MFRHLCIFLLTCQIQNSYLRLIPVFFFFIFSHHSVLCKNKTNHPISSNGDRKLSKTLPQMRGGGYKQTGIPYNFDKVWSGAPNGRFGKLFLIRDAYTFEKSSNSLHKYIVVTILLANSHILCPNYQRTSFQKLLHFKI